MAARMKAIPRLFRANVITLGERGLNSNFDREMVSFDGQSPFEQNAFGVTLRLEKELNDSVDLTYVFGRETADVFSRGDIDGGFGAVFLGAGNFGPGFIPFPAESGGSVDDLTQTTHELRAAFDDGGNLRGQAGLFIFDEEIQITSTSYDTLAPGQPVNGLAVRDNETNSVGVFGSLTYDVNEQVTLQGGLRYTDESKDFTVARFIGPFGSGIFGPVSGSVSDEQFSLGCLGNLQGHRRPQLLCPYRQGFPRPIRARTLGLR